MLIRGSGVLLSVFSTFSVSDLLGYVSPAPIGPGIAGDTAGLKCHVLASASSPLYAQTCQNNFTFTCWDLRRAFGRALTI